MTVKYVSSAVDSLQNVFGYCFILEIVFLHLRMSVEVSRSFCECSRASFSAVRLGNDSSVTVPG